MKRIIGMLCAFAMCISEVQPVLASEMPVAESESEGTEKIEEIQNPTEKAEAETGRQPETLPESKPEESEVMTESEAESGSELVTEPETESEMQTEQESESELFTETESDALTETEPESERLTEPETESQMLPESENESEMQTEKESISETKAEKEEKADHNIGQENSRETDWQTDLPSYFPAWNGNETDMEYVEDFRFSQIPEEDWICTLADGMGNTSVYETVSQDAKQVGEIPYFGKLYILEQVDDRWAYIESGQVRGFVRRDELLDYEMAEELVKEIGADAFPDGTAWCEAADNAAFTYTHTTIRPVLAKKQYAIFVYSSSILEYAREDARKVGCSSSGSLAYILEMVNPEWVYVESGDVRGFVETANLLDAQAAYDLVKNMGEDNMELAEEMLSPEENRNCYYTLKSVKEACSSIGEQIADMAQRYVGKLGYVWGGTSLINGADCSGFTQSVFAKFGITIPRLAEEQGVQGMTVPGLTEAQPGDLVYWASGPHVGIYIGNGWVVQCSGDSCNGVENPGPGPTVSRADYMPVTAVRRYVTQKSGKKKTGSGGNRIDSTNYTRKELELIWAIVAQEDNGSYDGALAVISSAMNRTESARWSYCGSNALQQLTASGQYCYSIDTYWMSRLGGNVPSYVMEAVNDCLKKGIRNHPYTCFRSRKGKVTGADAVQIGSHGNWYFGT